jgi:replicative DNA helicase
VAHDDRQKKFRPIAEVLDEETDKLHRLSTLKTPLTGTPSGFKDLDELTGGFQPGNLIIVAARPSMGKSALVANIAENAVLGTGHPANEASAVALFSLEMSESELAQRFVASQARIRGEELRKGRVAENRWPKILDACQRLSGAPLWIDDSSDTGVLEVRAKARRLHHQLDNGLGLIIIDYLQLMRHEGRVESRVEQVGQISRGLKSLARELNVPVIALSQLSRAVEQRGGEKRPILSDLRESGQIEQDADLVMFIYREEYYDKDSERPGEADIIIAKHRNGPVGDVVLTFQKEYPKFMNYAGERFAA